MNLSELYHIMLLCFSFINYFFFQEPKTPLLIDIENTSATSSAPVSNQQQGGRSRFCQWFQNDGASGSNQAETAGISNPSATPIASGGYSSILYICSVI